MSIKRSSGSSGTYQGLEKVTDRQVKVTLGQRAKTRRAIQDNLGSYLIRTATQGAPAVGTWVSKGTATNTIRLVDEQNYTRSRVSTYTINRSSAYTRVSTRTRISNYLGDFIGNYTSNYIGDFIGNYSRNFLGNYTRNSTSVFSDTYIGTYSRNFAGEYSRNFIGN